MYDDARVLRLRHRLWGGRTRTFAWRLQRPLPYQLGYAPPRGGVVTSGIGTGTPAIASSHEMEHAEQGSA